MVKIASWMNGAIEEVKDEKLPSDKLERREFIKKYKVRIQKNKKLLSTF